MPICPKCGEEIHSLDLKNIRYGSMDQNGSIEVWTDYGDETIVYECPECDEELFSDDDAARAFMRGEKDGNVDLPS